MTTLLATFLLLGSLIVAAGILLTRFADQIAQGSAMSHSLAGLLLLAAATSLPELSIGWAAIRIDAVDLAVGELLGSCLWNLLLLGVLDLATRTRGRMLSHQSAAHALTATISLALVALAMGGLVMPDHGTWLRMSPFSWAIIVGYLLCIRMVYQDHRAAAPELTQEGKSWGRHPTKSNTKSIRSFKKPPTVAVAGYVCCAAVILIVAPKLASTTEQLAELLGIADTFLGVTMVALMTSLPEATTTVSAIRLGHTGMAVANIFGSNAFNLAILGTIDLASPISILSIASSVHLITTVAIVLTTSVALLGLLYRAEKRFWLFEPDALLVILLVIGALVLVYNASRI